MSDEPPEAAIARADKAAHAGRRTTALRALVRYSAAADAAAAAGVPADAGLEARARAVVRYLGLLPRGHHVPECVPTPDHFLAVLAANQDSPNKVLSLGWTELYAPAAGAKAGRTTLGLRASVMLNSGAPRQGGDDGGGLCAWRRDGFAVLPGGANGQPETRPQLSGYALAVHQAFNLLRGVADRAAPLGFTWPDRRRTAGFVAEAYGAAAEDPPEDVAAELCPAPAKRPSRGRRA